MGDAPAHLREALQALCAVGGVTAVMASPVYLTEPQGDPDQPWFANQVARLECAACITPEQLLKEMLLIEHQLGRLRDAQRRYGPRVIDLDLLLFGQETRSTPDLTLPHPRMALRAFVLAPLCSLEADLVLPDGRAAADILRALPYRIEGERIYQSSTVETAC